MMITDERRRELVAKHAQLRVVMQQQREAMYATIDKMSDIEIELRDAERATRTTERDAQARSVDGQWVRRVRA
jgi:hypothetical protein